jgi:predicted helicase
MFKYISFEDLPYSIELIIDEIADVLDRIDKRILRQDRDPILYFYETFLSEYDPKERREKGVYYTPESVVSYIVRSIDSFLEEKFHLTDGLASKEVTILDPAGGTLTFLSEAIKNSVRRHSQKYGEGTKKEFIREHILGDFYAFELMIAPYVIGHLRMSFLLKELGYELEENERIKFYLTDTLEKEDIEQTSIHGIASLAEESRKAGEVKKKIPILVVLGNPPYHGKSENMGKSACALIEPYKLVDGKDFHERKHWLHDDYVKFIRFAEEKIAQTGKGVVGYITNHRYIENPTFRGMRQHLTKSFDEIYILDLHGGGSSDMKPPPNIKKDENVFDITKGVAISFFMRKEKQNGKCRVYYSEKWGLKDQKYAWLLSNDKTTTSWEEIHPHAPSYLFVPMKDELEERYHKFWKITDIFPVSSVGFVTARDQFAIDTNRDKLKSRLTEFYDLSMPTETIRKKFKLKDYRSFRVDDIRRQRKFNEKSITKCIFRPFDERYVYYERYIVQEWQFRVLSQMLRGNIALISARSNKSPKMDHFFCTQYIMETKCGESTTQSCLFPLYLYSENGKTANINPRLVRLLEEAFGKSITPEEIFQYVYGVVYSNTYRDKYTSFLRIDFPRVPLTNNLSLFAKIAELGRKLVELHVLRLDESTAPIAKFQGEGNNVVEKQTYDKSQGRIQINGTQYFEGISEEIWNFQIGGYQVLGKWLRHRKGKKLSLEEIKYFCKVVIVIKKTMDIQKEIDDIYGDIENGTLEFIEDDQKVDLRSYT